MVDASGTAARSAPPVPATAGASMAAPGRADPARPPGAGARTRTGWTLLLASLGSFLAALDVVVVATALPVMRVQLGASLAGLEWTVNAYNLVFACLMMTGAA